MIDRVSETGMHIKKRREREKEKEREIGRER